MPAKTVEALVLQVRAFGEADLIIDLFALHEGRLKGIAKGAKKSKKRFVHCFEPLNRVRLTLFEKPNYELARIDQGELLEPFPGIRRDFRKWGMAAYCGEMIQALFAVGDPHPEIFALMNQALTIWSSGRWDREVFTIVRLRLLKSAGYGLFLDGCLGCGKGIAYISRPVFSAAGGGIYCAACQKGENGNGLSRGTLETLRRILTMPLPQVFRIRFNRETETEIEGMVQAFSGQVLGKELEAARYLKQIQEPYG